MTSKSTDAAIESLRNIAGRIIVPADVDYDALRMIVYGGFDARPAAIARVAGTADIVKVIAVARDSGLPLAVRSGGHSNAGHSNVEGGIVLDLRELKRIEIDLAAETVWAGTGVTAAELTAELEKHGKVVGFGDAGTVGIGGITLGGGVGYMARKYGLSIDALRAAELVTADGQVLLADKDTHPDLFWALRGGGGNFGVATRLQYRLSPLPAFTGGMLCLPATPETVAGFIAAAEAAPEELSTIANVMPAPPMPFLPEALHGSLVILGMLAFAGPDEAAQQALAPFRALATPLADFVKPGSYTQSMYPPEDGSYHPTAVARTMFMNRVDTATAATMVDALAKSDATLRVVQLRVLGGAVARVPVEATAYAHRKAPIMANVAAFYTTPEDKKIREAWVAELGRKLEQDDAGAYVNFLGEDGPQRIAAAYPGATWERLRRIKRQYDPQNLFRRNQNIPPAA